MATRSTARVRVRVVVAAEAGAVAADVAERQDEVVGEEPLEVRVREPRGPARTFTVTMRTPDGHDTELAVGLLRAEGVIGGRADVRQVAYCTDVHLGEQQRYNVVTVDLAGPAPAAFAERARPLTTSACGVCGTTTLDAVAVAAGTAPLPAGPVLPAAVIAGLPDRLRAEQRLFDRTGGLHAAALVAADGALLAVREDVGRHNAVDKVVGGVLLADPAPPPPAVLVVSGRAGFEIVQKALAAQLPVVVSVSAPTSLSVDLARRFGLTLIGFARGGRFTVYTGAERVA